jgi:hypothetical protein
MAKQMPYAGELGNMQRLVSSLEANRADLGHLEGSLTEFGELVTRAQDLAKQQAALTAAKQDATKQLRTQMDEALRLATLLRSALRQRYGIRSEKLAEFGLQPFRGRTRKATPPAPVNPEPPAPADPAPTTPANPSR